MRQCCAVEGDPGEGVGGGGGGVLRPTTPLQIAWRGEFSQTAAAILE